MLAETRRKYLLDLITRQGYATLDELVKVAGRLREHGPPRSGGPRSGRVDQADAWRGGLHRRGEVHAGLRRAHRDGGRREAGDRPAAAALLEDGDTVLLDGGTTTLEVARALVGRRVQVVTNSLPIAQLLASSQQTDLILIGGYVYPRTGVALGPLAIATMQVDPRADGDPGRGGHRGRGDLQLELCSWSRPNGR